MADLYFEQWELLANDEHPHHERAGERDGAGLWRGDTLRHGPAAPQRLPHRERTAEPGVATQCQWLSTTRNHQPEHGLDEGRQWPVYHQRTHQWISQRDFARAEKPDVFSDAAAVSEAERISSF